MPFSRSRSMASSTWAIISRWASVPVRSSSRSARVDLPWSMCAMMTKFLMWFCSKTFGRETNTVISALAVLLLVACQSPTLAPTPAPTSSPPPPATSTRVDLLNQANAAFAAGDLASASGLYERVINTPPNGETRETTFAINDFARFRDIVSQLSQGNEDQAKAQLDALQRDDPNAALARLGAQLWDQYGMVGDLKGACAQLQPDIASQAGPTLAALSALGVSDPGKLCG